METKDSRLQHQLSSLWVSGDISRQTHGRGTFARGVLSTWYKVMHILKKKKHNNQTDALLEQTVYHLKLLNLSPQANTKRHLLEIKLNYHCNSKDVLYEKLKITQINEP